MKTSFKIIIPLALIILGFVGYDYCLHTIRWGMWDNFWGSLYAGLAIAVIYFFLDEYVLYVNLNGEWNVEEYIDETSYSQYKDYKLFYTYHIWQNGNQIKGYGEKIKQDEGGGTITIFEPSKRVRVEFEGHIEKSYLKKSIIYLLIYEKGRIRESSTTYTLQIKDNKKLEGEFKSTAASARGRIILNQKL